MPIGRRVSVPFRGSCSEIISPRGLPCLSGGEFPSPFGVRVLKSVPAWSTRCRFVGFPSPFGVRVLKCHSLLLYVASSSCFRPLSGFVF